MGTSTEEVQGPGVAVSPTPTREAVLIRRLCRWIVLRPQVAWLVYDQLEELPRLIQRGVRPVPSQVEFLEKAIHWAKNLGFDPEIDPEDGEER